MKKIETLKKNYEFKNVLNKGKYLVKKQIIVYITKNKKEKNIIGIAINTKLCNAVNRNKLKRLIRENYRLLQPMLENGYNIVFLWNKKTSIDKANSKIIKNDMIEAFKDFRILKENI